MPTVELPFLLSAIMLAIVLTIFITRGFNPFSSQYSEIAKGDRQLIKFAANIEGLSIEQQAYISYMGRRLISYNLGHVNNALVFRLIGVLILSANYISVGVTGTDYVACSQAKSLSFVINLVAALLTAVSQFFLFQKESQSSQRSGSQLRWEIWQFVGASQEYKGLALTERYNEFARQTDILIANDLVYQNKMGDEVEAAQQKARQSSQAIRDENEGRS